MNGIQVNRMRQYEAQSPVDSCRPIRMQGRAWRADNSPRDAAWGRALRNRAIWRRSLLAGCLAGLPLGVVGGLAVGLCCTFVQCWQFVDAKCVEQKNRLN